MPKIIEEIKHAVDYTIPEKEEIEHLRHPKVGYILIFLRNILCLAAVVLFVIALFLHDSHNVFKSIGYFSGAAAYIFEFLAATDCFKTKVPHTEMFMIYCFGPLYILMGFGYIFLI